MGDVGRFVIGECVTAKAIHVLHLSECVCCCISDKKTKRLVGLVVTNVNIPTSTVLIHVLLGWALSLLTEHSVRAALCARHQTSC